MGMVVHLIKCTLGDGKEEKSFACSNPLSQPFDFAVYQNARIRANLAFSLVVPSETIMTERSFELASTGSILLHMMVEKNKPCLDIFHCFSPPQSPSTAATKTEPFYHLLSTSRGLNGRNNGSFGVATS